MPLPSGASAINLSQIKTEFGPNDTISPLLSAYRKFPGGTRVGATPLTVPIPTALPITIRSFAGTQTGYPQTTNDFTTGASTVTIPSGVRTINIDVWGGGGGGGGAKVRKCTGDPGGGGGGGGLARSILPITGPSWGLTISYSVGAAGAGGGTGAGCLAQAGGASTSQSGTFAITAMTGNGGGVGPTSVVAGAGGTATGGTTANPTGNAGSIPAGAAGLAGTGANTGGAGGNGGVFTPVQQAGQPAQSGRVLFTWT